MAGKRTSDGRRTPQRAWERAFLDDLSGGHTVTHAIRAAQISRDTAYRHRREDEAFAARWDDAYEEGTDVIEQEALRRAVQGSTKVFYDKDGGIRGEEQVYSDRLMELMLKARRPHKFRDRVDVRHSGQIAQPTAAELEANRSAGLDDGLEQALANVASLDAARARRAG